MRGIAECTTVKGAVDDLDRVLDILTETGHTEDQVRLLCSSRALHAGDYRDVSAAYSMCMTEVGYTEDRWGF
jgi:hypothetical protein